MDLIISAVTQRTGSTMLQRIFNQRKKTLIWGEHSGVISYFYRAQEAIINFASRFQNQTEAYFNSGENTNQWIACMCPENKYANKAIVKSLKTFLDSYYEPYRETHDIIGFKEVTYGRELLLLRKAYPKAKIMLLVRNPIDIWKSMPKQKLNKRESIEGCINFIDMLKQWNNNTSFYIEMNKEDSLVYLIKYEDIIRKDYETLEIISGIGKLTKGEINSVLKKKIGSTANYIDKGQIGIIKELCKENMEKLNYI